MANPHLDIDISGSSFAVNLPHLSAAGTFAFDPTGESSITVTSAVVSPPHHSEIPLIDSPITLTGVNIAHILEHFI
jgi:hypothetical protein